jgi:outer membrane protein assembly factor BamE (lipoprotein component of BamABCDE complex)
LFNVKSYLAILMAVAVVLTGCKSSTVETRRAERPDAYAALQPDQRQLVDQGQIKVGMSEDAVYIAWGKPAQVVTSEDQSGRTTTWLYHGSVLEENRYWSYREVSRDGRVYLERYLDRDYNSRDYVSSEIVFQNGVVLRWRTLPRPTL